LEDKRMIVLKKDKIDCIGKGNFCL